MIIKLLVLADKSIEFNAIYESYESREKNFDITRVETFDELKNKLSTQHFSIIVTLGISNDELRAKYPKMFTEMPSYYKNKWFNFYNLESLTPNDIGYHLLDFYGRLVKARPSDFFSIITPVYHTKRYTLERTYQSLLNQTFPNWEWIIIDDSKDKDKTPTARAIANNDYRVKYYSFEHSGIIGEVKRKGFSLAEGDYLLELDHDDVLTPNTLDYVKKCFDMHPDSGFVYSDCAEININKYNEIVGYRNYSKDENGNPTKGNWGNSKTGYATEFNYNGYDVLANVSPFINPQSIRHITSAPNHLRCWRRDVYEKIKKHSNNAHIVDDYELVVRTFLETKLTHLNNTGYVQFYETDGEVNTQYNRNKEIQRLTHFISKTYDKDIHNRILELGYDDYCWNDKLGYSEYWKDFGPIGDKFKMN